MIKDCIQDLLTIQSSYPTDSRGYCSLQLAIRMLTQLHDADACSSTPGGFLSRGAGSVHWVLGEGAGSANGTITVEPGTATFSVEYKNA